ncbi:MULTISPECIES: hypothetical protein [unclassified Exiguobacterium]|uniref:hypothetical protein n=1 Tax=unclassified Exiguobacterium TaxID=2644629 RepID=UPI000B5930F5|nr:MULTISPECIES: hypothetical protein [unclassified Exiguobacterium]ASI35109.1 hypothetical protein A0126_05845 [Exiguobacterium sp. N4-1P]
MRKSYEFFLLYNKEMFFNKFAYLYTLAVPLVIILLNHFDWFKDSPTWTVFQSAMIQFFAIMIVLTAINGIGISLLNQRESGFLKMYTFLSGQKFPVIFGRLMSQWFFLSLNMFAASLMMAVLFHQPLLKTVLMTGLLALIIPLPVFACSLLIAALPLKPETMTPLGTILIFAVFIFIDVFELTDNRLLAYFSFLNPANLILNEARFLTGSVSDGMMGLSILTGIMVYLVVGYVAYQRLSITSKTNR